MLSTINYSPGHRNLMLLFPVPVVLCLLLLFHGLGGGKDSDANSRATAAPGINTTLPPAKTNSGTKAPDKVQIYESAAADSARFREQQKQDPNIAGHPGPQPKQVIDRALDQRKLAADAKAGELMVKLQKLQKELDYSASARDLMPTSAAAGSGEQLAATGMTPRQTPSPDRRPSRKPDPSGDSDPWRNPDLDRTPSGGLDPALARLSALSQSLRANPNIARDPEMERIDAMLDKLIRIQHPNLVINDTVKTLSTPTTFALEPEDQKEAVASLQREATTAEDEEASAGFIEIADEDMQDTTRHRSDPALGALIDGDQTVTSGSTVALRLINACVVNGLDIPSGQQLYGQVTIADQRMMIHISSLRVGDQVMPVALQVYDLDGLLGIRAPGAVNRDVSKESASEAISGLGLASMDPSLIGQASNAGLQLAKTLTSRKVRTVRVQLPAGYQVLLVNTKTK